MLVRWAVLVCGLSVAAAGAAVAQDQAPPPPPQGQVGPPNGGGARGGMDPGRRLERMKHELNLTDDQTSQVKAILEDGRTKMEALRSNSSLSQEDRRSQGMSLRKAENDKIEALLTPDQKTKFATMQEHMRNRMRNGSPEGAPAGGPPPPPPPAPPQS
ncbi:MAG TPA: hypothetical protein VFW30_00680 [Bryocella sp.]|nr:hypothetical protein [Bryocella sp.]